jgi:hypothetical protein
MMAVPVLAVSMLWLDALDALTLSGGESIDARVVLS